MLLKAIASAVPEWVVDNASVAAWSSLDATMISEKIGVQQRRFLRHSESGVDLAARAVEQLGERDIGFDASRIGLVIFVTQTPDYRLPHNAALLQHKVGIPQEAATFDVSLGCSGFVYALSLAKALMVSEEIEEGLVVTCDPYSKIMDRENREVIGLFGDAATATWLRADGVASIGRGDFGTDGSGAHHLIVRAGGAAMPRTNMDGTSATERVNADESLSMNGRAIFNFMMTRVPLTMQRCLDRNGLSKDDVDYFVFHQASRFLLETLRDRLKLPADRVPIMLAETGNTVSSTVPLVLETLMRDGHCAGSRVLVSGFGVGLSWASNVLTFGASENGASASTSTSRS